MSKRKVQFAESADDDLEQAFEEAGDDAAKKKRRLPERESRFKEKHSLDSDEEDIPEKYNLLDEDDIEGVVLLKAKAASSNGSARLESGSVTFRMCCV